MVSNNDGYDLKDYYDINPKVKLLMIIKNYLKKLKKRDSKIIIDLVIKLKKMG